MKRRSYEFYECRSDLGGKGEELQFRGTDAVQTRNHFEKLGLTVDEQQGSLYLVRVTVIEVIKHGS